MAKVATNNIVLAMLLVFNIVVSVTSAYGRLDNLALSSPRPEDDRIYFKDEEDVSTVEINGRNPLFNRINSSIEGKRVTPTHSKPLPRGCDDALCANPLDYPAADIAMLLRSSDRKLTESFVVDAIDRKFDFRLDGDENEIHLCDSVEEIYFPKTAERKDGSWLFLVNENREQGVYINKCLKQNQPCKMAEVFPFQYRTECKQQYIYRQLVAVEEGVTKIDRFRIPTGCSCVLYQKTVN